MYTQRRMDVHDLSNRGHSDEQVTRVIINIVGIFFPHGLSLIS